MLAIKNATNDVRLLFRPVGFKARDNKKATSHEVKYWLENNSPGPIKRQSNLTIIGACTTIVGIVVGIFGFKQDSKFGKWFGGLLTVLGIGSSGIGMLKIENESTLNLPKGKEIEGKNDEDKVKNAILIIKDDKKYSKEGEPALWFLLKTGGSEALKAIEDLIKDKTKDAGARELFLSAVASSGKQKEFAKTLLINIIQEASLETLLMERATQLLLGCKDLELTAPEKESAKKILIEILNNDSLKPKLREIAISALEKYFNGSEVLNELKEASKKIEGDENKIGDLKWYIEGCIQSIEYRLSKGFEEYQN